MSTLKPSRLSSSATSRASLIGSFSGASASGYLALPMTSAYRSPAAKDGAMKAAAKINVRSNTRRIFMLRRSSKKGAGFPLAPRRHYSTHRALSNRGRGASTACNIELIATIDRNMDSPGRIGAAL